MRQKLKRMIPAGLAKFMVDSPPEAGVFQSKLATFLQDGVKQKTFFSKC